MKRYTIYSDASFDKDKQFGVFAWVVLYKERIYSQGIGSGKVKNAFQAEIGGLQNAIDSLPDGVSVTAHSDIRQIHRILAQGSRSKHSCVKKLTQTCKRKNLCLAVEFERDESARSCWYRHCHDRANGHLRMSVGRGGKIVGER